MEIPFFDFGGGSAPSVPIPDDWQGFAEKWSLYWRTWATGENFLASLSFLGNLLYVLSMAVLCLLPAVVLAYFLLKRFAKTENNDWGKDTKPLRIFKRITTFYLPVKQWVLSFIGFLRDSGVYWKIWLALWLFYFNTFTIALEFIAYYLYFVVSFDFVNIYRQVYKLLFDLWAAISFIPLWGWIILALFLIDRVQYEAQVKSARAAVNVAKAALNTQKLTVENKTELNKKQIISDYDLQMARNTLASCEAQLAQAKATLLNAQEQLSYCTVVSPSDGVVGEIPYRVGSLVSSSTATPLTTVSNISEMYVYFSMTEKQLLTYTRKSNNVQAVLDSFPSVQLQLSDGTMYNESGKIETVSGVIDQTTGSAQMRATFPNPQKMLRSGGTGSILVPTVYNDIIMIPQKATYEIQDKKFVYVVDKNSKVASREVKVAPQDDGTNYIVTSGLTKGERIVTEGVTTLEEGMQIKPITKAEEAKKRAEATTKKAETEKK